MTEDWRRRPEIIEGEYEIVEERYMEVETNPKPPYVTYLLLGINIAAWLIMSLAGLFLGWNTDTQLFYFGAKVNSLIVRGQYWRLITAMFLHIGILHLFFNSYALYMYGPIVEKLFGRVKFLLVYILSGLAGSILSYVFSPNPSAGASGAIFGLMGALLYFRQQKKRLFHRIFGPNLMIIIGINLFYGFAQPGIDNWGHIGGLIGGYVVSSGIGLYHDRRISIKKALSWLIIIVLVIFGLRYGNYKYGKEVYLEYAYSALRDGDMDAALESINYLLEYDPDDINFLFIRAQILEQKQDYGGALEDYLKVTDVEKGSAEVWFRAGRAAYNLGRIAEAREYLEKALEIEPRLQKARDLLEHINSFV